MVAFAIVTRGQDKTAPQNFPSIDFSMPYTEESGLWAVLGNNEVV